MKVLNVIDDENELKHGSQLRNMDLLQILSNLGLVEYNEENLKTFDDFFEYLFKLGIEAGINNAKQLTIGAIKEDEKTFDEIMEVDAESLIDFNFEPYFAESVKERIFNAK